MERTLGRPEIVVALVDGPVSTGATAIPVDRIREAPGAASASCAAPGSEACKHGTFVASILAADRDAGAPGICPSCAFMARPVFSEAPVGEHAMPSATPEALAAAITDCVA